jgi:hypothetical protein
MLEAIRSYETSVIIKGTQDPHDVTSQKMAFSIVTTVDTSNLLDSVAEK